MEPERPKKKLPASQKPKTTDFSSKRPQIEEIHSANSLVGSIIEKGFSSTSSSPSKPSAMSYIHPKVLPFPVARHRSHGPHWNPSHIEPEFEEEDDKDETDFSSIAAFASPIKRKKKKGMDFSRWRNFVSQNDYAASKPTENLKKISSTAFEELVSGSSKPAVVVERAKSSSSEMEFCQSNGVELSEEMLGNFKEDTEVFMSDREGFDTGMEDIHTENLSRLRQMSVGEIADAQSEIMEKMNPAMVEMLRKRGQEKLGNIKVVQGSVENGKKLGKEDVLTGMPSQGTKSTAMAPVHGDSVCGEQFNGNSWKIWSERVEKVRELRFNLEGDALNADSYVVSGGCKPEGVQLDIENVAKRDFLRTEGDPAALGYSIKELIVLIRSMVPAQRALALKVLDSILNKAMLNLLNDKGQIEDIGSSPVDWPAIWAYALGPEPELVLSLRIVLDDNHDSVILACANVIQSILSCDMNEDFFNVAEKIPSIQKVICTAPIFRSRAEIDSSFLQGGYWKYNTKTSNILPSNTNDDKCEGEHTIQDDVVVAGQDIAAGFIRMGLLPRICYLLEMEPISALVESLVSVLIGLARHSVTCANAIVQCPRLIQNVVNILTRHGMTNLTCQIKAITILKVLSQMDKHLCSNFVKDGVFQQVMWHWYKNLSTIDQWVKSGNEHCKLTAALMVEQLRLWKVCISYGYCVAYFTDFFPNMCLWLSRPTFNKLIEYNVLNEFARITTEAYLTLGALAERLPCLYSMNQLSKQDAELGDDVVEPWSWSHVVPMVDLAISWLSLSDIPFVSWITSLEEDEIENKIYNSSASSMIWVISAVLHMLCCIFGKISLRRADDEDNSTSLPWLPEFVPKVGIEILKNRFLTISGLSDITLKGTKVCSLVNRLCYLRHHDSSNMALSSLSCLYGLVKLASLIDECIQRARSACDIRLLMKNSGLDMEGKVLAEGIIKRTTEDLTRALDAFAKLVSSEWPMVQSIEAFSRGGPAPGVGVGWGSPNGGFWSLNILLAQEDAMLVLELFKKFPIFLESDLTYIESINLEFVRSLVNGVLSVCLVAGPGGRVIVEEAFNILFQPPLLRYLGLFLYHFLELDKRLKLFHWLYEDKDYLLFSKLLNSHFRERWLSIKMKMKPSSHIAEHNQIHGFPRKNAALETIHESRENPETPCSSFCVQWVQQRLPLPKHWFLSAICCIGEQNNIAMNSSNEDLEVAKSGLFFLLCIEALSSSMFNNQDSPVLNLSLVWKLHALSMSLHANMAVLEDERTRDVFKSLQELYGRRLDELRHKEKREFRDSLSNLSETHGTSNKNLSFQSQINESYSTFVENLVRQFGAVSYGDTIFSRQVAIYLHRSVDVAVRLAAWNVLSNSYLLELLPPLEMCFSEAEGYLEPPEDDVAILEAYAKSWSSGSLDKAFARGSLGFSLAQHHLHSFIFKFASSSKLNLRKKLLKSLLRSHSQKHHNLGMLLHLVKYELPVSEDPSLVVEIGGRFELLMATCEGNSSLIAVVENLKSIL